MKLPENIEKSAFRKGEYLAYCNGTQRIRRTFGGWETYALGSQTGTFVRAVAPTLKDLAYKLARISSLNK